MDREEATGQLRAWKGIGLGEKLGLFGDQRISRKLYEDILKLHDKIFELKKANCTEEEILK